MKKIILILIAALMLTGCTEKSAVFGAGSSSAKKLTCEQIDAYRFFAQSTGCDPVEITDSEIINELWVYLSECEDGERCRFSEGCEPAGVNSDTDTLILKDKLSGAEYSIAAGYPFRSTNTKDDEPVIRISGYINEDELLWAAYKDVHGNFETLLDGLAERASGSTEPPALLTDNALEDYEITGSIDVYDHESNTYTKYSGAVSEDVTGELWELLCVIDRGSPIILEGTQTVGGGCIGGGLVFRNKNTGEGFWVSDGILYAAPELDGGVSVLVIGGRYYGDGYLEEYGVTASKKIEELLIKGVAREENVVERIVYELSDPWKDKPEKLTDMNFEELEFTGKADVYDPETGIATTYQGYVSDEVCAELWALLGEIEKREPASFAGTGSIGSYDEVLWVSNTVTGDEYCIYYGIYYSDCELGGSRVFAIDGRFRDGSQAELFHTLYDENGNSLCDKFIDVFLKGLMREENVYARVLPSEPIVVEKKDIAMVHSYCNWAWGYQLFGEFVDFAGNVYWFDLSDEEVGSDKEFMKLLEDGHFNGKFGDPAYSVKYIDELWEIAGLADQVAEDAKIVKKHEAYDAGQDTIYAVNSEHELVEIYSEGDFRRINTDPNAVRIMAIREKNDIL